MFLVGSSRCRPHSACLRKSATTHAILNEFGTQKGFNGLYASATLVPADSFSAEPTKTCPTMVLRSCYDKSLASLATELFFIWSDFKSSIHFARTCLRPKQLVLLRSILWSFIGLWVRIYVLVRTNTDWILTRLSRGFFGPTSTYGTYFGPYFVHNLSIIVRLIRTYGFLIPNKIRPGGI